MSKKLKFKKGIIQGIQFFVDDLRHETVWLPYAHLHWTHNLYICVKCGELYAEDSEGELYQGAFEKRAENTKCVTCLTPMSEYIAKYPETYLSLGGEVRHFKMPSENYHGAMEPDDFEAYVVDDH